MHLLTQPPTKACNESSPCPAKITITCPCGEHKQHAKCLASSANPSPDRPALKCDDECLRHERNRRLAAALNIDTAAGPLTDHVPYEAQTLDLYRQLGGWAEAQEREFRVFSQSADEVRLRYTPTPLRQRQFLHLLAEDFGLEHQSEDLGPHRHVLIFKGPRFVSAPTKTIIQCIKIRDQQTAEAKAIATAAARAAAPPPADKLDPFNALVIISPSFGLTIDDLRTALSSDLATQPSFHFSFDFLPSEEVLIRATVQYSAFLSPGTVETTLATLKTALLETIRRSDLAGNILLCHVDGRNEITRREGVKTHRDGSGWSAVASKASQRTESPWTSDDQQRSASSAKGTGKRLMLGLKKKKVDKSAEKPWGVLEGDAEC